HPASHVRIVDVRSRHVLARGFVEVRFALPVETKVWTELLRITRISAPIGRVLLNPTRSVAHERRKGAIKLLCTLCGLSEPPQYAEHGRERRAEFADSVRGGARVDAGSAKCVTHVDARGQADEPERACERVEGSVDAVPGAWKSSDDLRDSPPGMTGVSREV